MAKSSKYSTAPIFGSWQFGRINYLLFGGGILLIIVAYILMDMGGTNGFLSLTAAPVLLLVAYLVIIPTAIMIRPKRGDQGSTH